MFKKYRMFLTINDSNVIIKNFWSRRGIAKYVDNLFESIEIRSFRIKIYNRKGKEIAAKN